MNTLDRLIFYKKDLIALGYAENERQFRRKLATGRLPQGIKTGTAKNAHREWTRQELVDWETAEELYILRPRPPAGAEPVDFELLKRPRRTIWGALEDEREDEQEPSPAPKGLKMMVSYSHADDKLAPVLDAALGRMKKGWH